MKKRVKLPLGKPKRLLDLATKVQAKHVADGDVSPLKSLDWTQFSPNVEAALDELERAERCRREMVEAYQQRDLKMQVVLDFLRNSRDVLTGTFKREMKSLGQWGFEVLDVRSVANELPKEGDAVLKSE